MNLSRALRLEGGMCLALVGAGGKSAAISQLVKELEGQVPIVVTTSTHLAAEQAHWTTRHLTDLSQDSLTELERYLSVPASVLVTGPLDPHEGKWTGLDQPALKDLWQFSRQRGAALLIEADGARKRWIKAPADHEPAIPDFVDLVAPVVGMHAWGAELGDEIAHRPELLAKKLGIDLGARLQAAHFVNWATNPDLGLKQVPADASVRPILNQADTPERLQAAQEIATQCLENRRIEAVVIANIGRAPERIECIGRIAGVVLAAGGSSRAEGNKLLYEWRGEALIRHVVGQGLQAGLDPLIVVLGSDQEAIEAALADFPIVKVYNPDWQTGQSTSLKVGLGAARASSEGTIFLLGDMPLVSADLIRDVIRAHQTSLASIVAPRIEGRWGNPALFDRSTYNDLLQLEGDKGGRELYQRYEPQAVPAGKEAWFDCDSQADLAWLRTNYP